LRALIAQIGAAVLDDAAPPAADAPAPETPAVNAAPRPAPRPADDAAGHARAPRRPRARPGATKPADIHQGGEPG